jgi:hypothetical protein
VKVKQSAGRARHFVVNPRVGGILAALVCFFARLEAARAQDAGTTTVTNLSVQGVTYYSAPNVAQMRIAAPGGDTNSGTFNISSVSNPNFFGETRPNDVFRICYNMSSGGGWENPNDSSFGYEFETHYAPSATERVFEHHLSYFSQATGHNLRPWSWLIYKSSSNPAMVDRIEHSIATDKLSFTSSGGQNQWMVFQPSGSSPNSGGEISLIGPTEFVFLQNGYSPFIQLNNAGWSRSLIFLDGNNHIRVGANGDPLSLNEKLMWEDDGRYDIGVTNSNRPRDLFLARNAVIGGAVGIGVDNPAYTLQVNGSVAGVGPYMNLSDARYKENVATITNALAKVMALRGVSFDWKQGGKNPYVFDAGSQLGVIAQEVRQVLPEAVSQAPNGDYSVAYSEIVPVLLQAIKEQQAGLGKMGEALRAKEEELQTLTTRLERLERLVSARSAQNAPAQAIARREPKF